MAAANKNSKAGFQQFPETEFSIPNKKEMEERIYLALNVKDGQKSVGQSLQDPYTQALKYIEEHRIVEVFQVTMTTNNYIISFIWGSKIPRLAEVKELQLQLHCSALIFLHCFSNSVMLIFTRNGIIYMVLWKKK